MTTPSPVTAVTDLLEDLTASDETGWTVRLSRHDDGAWLLSVDCDTEALGRHAAGLLLGDDTGRVVGADLIWSGRRDEGDDPTYIHVLARCDDASVALARAADALDETGQHQLAETVREVAAR